MSAWSATLVCEDMGYFLKKYFSVKEAFLCIRILINLNFSWLENCSIFFLWSYLGSKR